MKRQIIALAAGALLWAPSSAAQASPLIPVDAPGSFVPSDAAATLLTFDSLPAGALPSYAFAGGTLTGNGGIESGTTGTYAAPAGDGTPYLTVSLNAAGGSTVLHLTDPENYFGLLWGSMDSYNSIVFLMNGVTVAQYSGTAIASLTGLDADGDQGAAASNRYVNFNFGGTFFDEVDLVTTNYAFEVDDLAFGDPIPEPATLALFLTALGGICLLRRKRAA